VLTAGGRRRRPGARGLLGLAIIASCLAATVNRPVSREVPVPPDTRCAGPTPTPPAPAPEEGNGARGPTAAARSCCCSRKWPSLSCRLNASTLSKMLTCISRSVPSTASWASTSAFRTARGVSTAADAPAPSATPAAPAPALLLPAIQASFPPPLPPLESVEEDEEGHAWPLRKRCRACDSWFKVATCRSRWDASSLRCCAMESSDATMSATCKAMPLCKRAARTSGANSALSLLLPCWLSR